MAKLQQRFYSLVVGVLIIHAVFAQNRLDIRCNPSLHHRFEDCPKGYCCVRDEFLPTYVYCRKIGLEDENCTTRESDSECPCAQGLYCKTNIVSSFVSLYGRCYNSSKDATTTTEASTVPTTVPTSPTTIPTSTTTGPTTTMAVASSDTMSPVSTTSADAKMTTGSHKVTTGDSIQMAVTTSSPVQTRPAVDFPLPIIG